MNIRDSARKTSASFIVRVWRDGESALWRGEVEHVNTGERRLFADDSGLIRFIQSRRQEAMSDS